MSVLVDSSFFIAVKSLRDGNHDRAVALLSELIRGDHGVARTTDFVFGEAITTALARTHRHTAAVGVGEMILLAHGGSPLFAMHHVTPDELREAWSQFRRYRDRELSMTDWTSIVVARDLEIDAILSFDHGFDGIHPRMH